MDSHFYQTYITDSLFIFIDDILTTNATFSAITQYIYDNIDKNVILNIKGIFLSKTFSEYYNNKKIHNEKLYKECNKENKEKCKKEECSWKIIQKEEAMDNFRKKIKSMS